MAEIEAFRGVLYNTGKVSSLDDVVAPPYDVINDEGREKLYARHPHNIVRLILGKEFEGDDDKTNKYSRAAGFFSQWQREGALARDDAPAVYLYNQEYESEGRQKVRKGFLVRIKLEAFDKGIVLPHEATLAKPVEDRLKLFRATECNLSPVFGLYADREKELDRLLEGFERDLPAESLKDGDGAGHELRRLTDATKISRIVDFMKDRKVIIADGHHRYTTALAYKKEMEEKFGPNPKAAYNYVLMFLTNMYGDGISVGPIHRLAHGVDFTRKGLLDSLRDCFEVEEVRGAEDVPESLARKQKDFFGRGTAFVLYFGQGDYVLLSGKEGVDLAERVPLDGPRDLKLLDVSVVHALLIEGALRISKEDLKGEKNIIYIKDTREAVRLVDAGKAKLACLMNPTRVDQVEAVAGRGYLMPQKSTFFYPKLLSGLVMNPIGRAED